MRLSKIKLAGFKSFVDPTTIHLISNLTAVAGPNGCGKSNVIDAVRWVMGESSAKHLRGGAIADVIFSGSAGRKPVGQATVELLFDNTLGKMGGEYATYAEIAIKRQVTRDGQSHYFLNGQRCRRRDITDIFLGTGLGPRSYAIIEQGMISRVIEAKPEELRTFIEEAAGISKYKERRRETENRIQHTLENLSRLNDLRGELENQLRHLQKQSQAAERYKTLKGEESRLSAQLAALAWKRLDNEIKASELKIRDLTTKLEEEHSIAQHFKTQQEKVGIAQIEANEALDEIQKHYYDVGAEIAKIEQSIHHHQERYQQLIQDRQEAEQTLNMAQSQLTKDQDDINHLQKSLAEMHPIATTAQTVAEEAIEKLQDAEFALETWREKTSQIQQAAIAPSRVADAEKAKIIQLEKQIHQTQERMNRLEIELKQQKDHESVDVESIALKIKLCTHQLEKVEDQIVNCHDKRAELTARINLLKPDMATLRQTLNDMHVQRAALEALQSSALGKEGEQRQNWILAQGLEKDPYLTEFLEVTQGWETAVEMVLEGFLEALGVEQHKYTALVDSVDALQQMGVSLVERSSDVRNDEEEEGRLIYQVKGNRLLPKGLRYLLNAVHISLDTNEALKILSTLQEGESVITPAGCWIGKGWIKVKANRVETQDGLLKREEKIKQLSSQILLNEEKIQTLQYSLDEAEEKCQELESEKESLNNEKNKLKQEKITFEGEQRIIQDRLAQYHKRHQQILEELGECQKLLQQSQQEMQASRRILHEALEEMSSFNNQQEILMQNKGSLQESVIAAKDKVKETNTQSQALVLKLQSYQTQLLATTDNFNRCQQQIDNVQNRVKNLLLSLAKNEEPVALLKQGLEYHLEKRIIVEQELSEARNAALALDNQHREISHQLHAKEQEISVVRDRLEQTRMQWQALQVRIESTQEKLKNTNFTLAELLEEMPVDADEKIWEENIREINEKIQRLGAINLAAIEEYEAVLQRKNYLDSQCNDLGEALTTLENAIKKIDRETRLKFQETFDQVNDQFKDLFPKLFGGGQANLTMMGDDLLDTGIVVIARPPGKKNSTIQQLSGGEKALTAVALVFSIFKLNPAPFCMLDEVDAPLDDSNVGRFCSLVKEMSKSIQFIYVSHNKLAIEMAEQLQGVTMREPGVSRLVTVDIEEAKSMAQA